MAATKKTAAKKAAKRPAKPDQDGRHQGQRRRSAAGGSQRLR